MHPRFYEIFTCDLSLDCDIHIESELYASKMYQPQCIKVCCHYAESFDFLVEFNDSLKAPKIPYFVVLPICEQYLKNRSPRIIRVAIQNTRAKQARLDAEASKAARRQYNDVGEAATIALNAPGPIGSRDGALPFDSPTLTLTIDDASKDSRRKRKTDGNHPHDFSHSTRSISTKRGHGGKNH